MADRVASVLIICDVSGALDAVYMKLSQKKLFELQTLSRLTSFLPPQQAGSTDVFLIISDQSPVNVSTTVHRLADMYQRPIIVAAPTSHRDCFDAAANTEYLYYANLLSDSFMSLISTRIRLAFTRYVSQSGHVRKYTTPEALSPKLAGARGVIEKPSLSGVRSFGNKLIAIGASAGGTEAIYSVLTGLPEQMPGIVIVQHMPPAFTMMYAQRLNRACALTVTEAVNNQTVMPGAVYIAPGGLQMRVRNAGGQYVLQVFEGEKVSGHAPSADVMFESVSQCAGRAAIGVILTGMGSDGAKGLLKMRQAGSHTIGQDEATCLVYGMPRAAFLNGAVAQQAPLQTIPSLLMRYANS